MSFLTATPDIVATAASNLTGIGSALGAASASAATPTTSIAAAAEDEVSTAVAGLFGNVGQEFQAFSAQAQAFHDQFVSTLNTGMGQYLSTEAANAQQTLLNALGIGTGGATPAAVVPFSQSFGQDTPFGAVALTLNGTADTNTGLLTLTSGSINAPTALVLGLDTLGAPLAAQAGWDHTSVAFASALQTGNPLGAAFALANAPNNIVSGFFVGQGTITEALPPPQGSGYTSASVTIPVGGLFAPVQPATFTATSSTGGTTSFPLGGPGFGGLIRALVGF
jgi:PE family